MSVPDRSRCVARRKMWAGSSRLPRGAAGGAPRTTPLAAFAVAGRAYATAVPGSSAAKTTCAGPSGQGYWLVGSDGGIFNYGAARYFGSTGATRLNKAIVGIAPTVDGRGYWLVASDGGIFAFGDAAFFGSTGAVHLNSPIVGVAATTHGPGHQAPASARGAFPVRGPPPFRSPPRVA